MTQIGRIDSFIQFLIDMNEILLLIGENHFEDFKLFLNAQKDVIAVNEHEINQVNRSFFLCSFKVEVVVMTKKDGTKDFTYSFPVGVIFRTVT